MERSERMKKAYEYLRFQGLAGTQEDVADMLKRQRTNVSSALNGNPKYLTDRFIIECRKTHRSLACVDELRIFLDISFVISKLFCTFVI